MSSESQSISESDSHVQTQRIHSLDAYRAVLMCLGIVIHGTIPFLRIDPETAPISTALIHFAFWFVHVFRMPAFFILSGYFGALLWSRYGGSVMLLNRYERIIAPLGFIMVFFSPLLIFIGSLGSGLIGGEAHAVSSAFTLALKGMPRRDFGHLWFLYHLGWISLCAVGIAREVRLRSIDCTWLLRHVRSLFESPWRFVVILSALHIIVCAPLQMIDVPAGTGWMPHLGHLTYYAVFYAFGWGLYVSKTRLSSAQEYAGTLVTIGSISTLIYCVLRSYHKEVPFDRDALSIEMMMIYGGGVVTWSVALFALTRGLMGLFYRYASRASRTWRYLSDASYWVYLAHLPTVIWIPKLLEHWRLPILTKYLIALVFTLVCCLVTYELWVRSSFIGKSLNGRRYPRSSRSLRRLGVMVMIGGWAILVAPRVNNERSQRAWEAQGGALSVIPFNLRPSLESRAPFKGNSSCEMIGRYAVCDRPRPFIEAQRHCAKLGAQLLTLESQEEQELISMFMRERARSSWIDLSDQAREGHWISALGVTPQYTGWGPHQPDNHRGSEHCAQIYWQDQRWNDFRCEMSLSYLCEPRLERSPEMNKELDALITDLEVKTLCASAIKTRARWRQSRETLSEIERELSDRIDALCPESSGLKTAPKIIPKSTPERALRHHRDKPEYPALKVLGGVWGLDEVAVLNSPRVLALSPQARTSIRGVLRALKVKLVFETERIRLVTQAWDHEDDVGVLYEIISFQDDIATLRIAEDESLIKLHIVAGGERLRVVQGDARWWLSRIQ